MRQTFKRRPKTRSSRRICEEKFCCPFIDSEAKYFCEDCKSAQCQACESEIHKTKVKYDFHYRTPIATISESSLCQAKKVHLVCQERNYPDLWCEQCKAQLCFTCFDAYHSSEKRRQHINVSMAYHLKKLQEQQQEQVAVELYESSEYYQDAVTDVISPQAPFSLSDETDSVTFCSFPQEADATNIQMNATSSKTNLNHSTSDVPDTNQGGKDSSAQNNILNVDPEPPTSFLLVDDKGVLQVVDEDDFTDQMGGEESNTFKVVSVFGGSRDRKSHVINQLFFEGYEVFRKSSGQPSHTGIWCSPNRHHNALVVDIALPLHSTIEGNEHFPLVLKILAISDIIVFHTQAEQIKTDMLKFLSKTSKAYLRHFKQELLLASSEYRIPMSELGPVLIVFHETVHSEALLDANSGTSSDDILKQMFTSTKNPVEAFSKICYVGAKAAETSTDFNKLKQTVTTQIEDMTRRSARRPEIIFQFLQAITNRYNQDVEGAHLRTLPAQYFTCSSRCLVCNAQCTLNMNHDLKTQSHDAGSDRCCEYSSNYGNRVFLCKGCLSNDKKVVIVPKTSSSSDTSWMGLTKYIWSGYVYECPNCGVICRSREHWFSNDDEERILQVDIRHVWFQGQSALDGTHNAARKVLEGLHYVADTVSSVGARPTKYLAECIADKIKPSYWIPNSEITKCFSCKLLFSNSDQKHHCRACGKGFCADCSLKKRPVPERGWGSEPVRVCDECFTKPDAGTPVNSTSVVDNSLDSSATDQDLTARKVGEAVSSTLSAMVSAFDYPIGVIKNSAKPVYWVPDEEITECCVCQKKFGPCLAIHHCRACGQGVCSECSPNKCIVPLRGWDYPVRVCVKCERLGLPCQSVYEM